MIICYTTPLMKLCEYMDMPMQFFSKNKVRLHKISHLFIHREVMCINENVLQAFFICRKMG